jgi:hypothetical protein
MSLETWWVLGVVTGAIGMGYVVYGRKAGQPVAFLAGIGLMVYPYFVDGLWWAIGIGVGLTLAPWFMRTD